VDQSIDEFIVEWAIRRWSLAGGSRSPGWTFEGLPGPQSPLADAYYCHDVLAHHGPTNHRV
jgi:hypothetical protein